MTSRFRAWISTIRESSRIAPAYTRASNKLLNRLSRSRRIRSGETGFSAFDKQSERNCQQRPQRISFGLRQQPENVPEPARRNASSARIFRGKCASLGTATVGAPSEPADFSLGEVCGQHPDRRSGEANRSFLRPLRKQSGPFPVVDRGGRDPEMRCGFAYVQPASHGIQVQKLHFLCDII